MNDSSFENVDQIYLQPNARHTYAYRYNKELASIIHQWINDKMGRRHAIPLNVVSEQVADNHERTYRCTVMYINLSFHLHFLI